MRSFNHRAEKRARPSDAAENVETEVVEEKRVRGRNKMHRPRNGQIAILPEGDKQFKYVSYSPDDTMKKGPILGVILKQEYPPLIDGITRDGQPIKYHASNWGHYSQAPRDDRQTPADRVKAEFWSIYSVPEGLEDEVDRVFEKYAHTQCKNMIYQVRVDAVKFYYREIIKSPKSDEFACAKELTFAQYMLCKPEWFTSEAWESICNYWTSDEYKKKRKRGQESRKKNKDPAQNRGGSRPLAETQQFIEKKYGPGAATLINTYCCMKSGLKNCDSNGRSGPVTSELANKRVADYNEALMDKYPENWQEQDFDVQVMYESSGGAPHGRYAIGDGAVKKADIINASKASNIRPANSWSHQNLMRMYQEEVTNNQNLVRQNKTLTRRLNRAETVLEIVCRKIDIEIPDMNEEEESDMRGTGDGCTNASANMDSNSDAH